MWLQRSRRQTPHKTGMATKPPALMLVWLLWLCCTWIEALPVATAQFVPDYMRAEMPDLQSSRTIAGICLLAISVPVYVVTIALLITRRRMYPLASRGSCCLTLLQVDGAVISTVNLALWIIYPRGMPCAMQVITLHLCSSYAAIWLIRGWKQVYRLEILSYLSELDWRENRIAQLQAREAAMKEGQEQDEGSADEDRSPVRSLTPKEAGPDSGASPAAVPTVTLIHVAPETATTEPVTRPAAVAVHPLLVYPSMESSSIPGHWFIHNRRFTSTRWIGGASLIWLCLLLATIVLPAVFDYDITLVNQWRRSHGMDDDTLSNHYLHGAFFESPRCLWFSIKWLAFFGSMVCFACPFGLFCAYRVYISSVRMKRRMQEQAEFAALMGHESDQRGVTPSASANATAASSSPLRTELDELAAVNVEMGVTVWVGLSNCILIFVLTAFDTSHVNLTTALTVWQGLLVSGIMPLRKSYTIEARQRELFRRARVKSGTRFVAGVEHHAPLYQLHHVLNSPTAYPALLRFLQKEYSSENALFFRSCEEFCRAARKLERALSSCDNWDLNPEEAGEFTIIPQGLNAGRMFLPQASSSHLTLPIAPGLVAYHKCQHSRLGSAQLTSFSIEPVPFVAGSQLTPVTVALPSGVGGGGVGGGCPIVREVSAVRTSSFSPPTMMSPRSTKVMHGSTEFHSTPSALRHGRTTSFSAKAHHPLAIALPVPALQMVQLQAQTQTQTQPQTPHGASFASNPQRSLSLSRVESIGRCPKWQPSMHLIESARATPAQWDATVANQAAPIPSATVVPLTPTAAAAVTLAPPPLNIRELHTEALSLRSRAIQLYDDYIKPNALYQVNVDASLQRFIGSQIQALMGWNPTLLDDAGKPDVDRAVREESMPLAPPAALSSLFKSAALSVFALIESDSFRRFLLTDDFQMLLQMADDAEMARRMAVASAEARTDVVLAKADEALRRCSRIRNEAAAAAAAALHHPPHVHPSSTEATVIHPLHSSASAAHAHVADFDAVHPVASSAMFNVDEADPDTVVPIDAAEAEE